MPMLGTPDAASYDLFDYRNYERQSMDLNEASRQAAAMRKEDPGRFYRVTPANAEGDQFHVVPMEPFQVYSEVAARLMSRWARMICRR